MGEEFRCDYDDIPACEKAVDEAVLDAFRTLKPDEVFEIRAKSLPWEGKADYGRVFRTRRERAADWGVAWYTVRGHAKHYFPDFSDRPLMARSPIREAVENNLGGYLLVARCRTPA